MIVSYPTDASHSYELPEGTEPKLAAQRAGQTFWRCDADGCDAEVKIPPRKQPKVCPHCGAKEPQDRFCAECGGKLVGIPVPDGWRTSDPDNDPLVGAAQACPKHAKLIYVPELDGPA